MAPVRDRAPERQATYADGRVLGEPYAEIRHPRHLEPPSGNMVA